jgi:tight adherence protein B
MDILFYGFVVFLFAAVILGIEGVYLWWIGTHGAAAQRVARRLQLMSGTVGRSGERISILKQRRFARNEMADRLLHRLALAHRIDRLLMQSGIRWSVQQFLLWSGAALLTGVVLVAQWPLPLALRIGLALLFALIPTVLVRRARKRRLARIEEQLPEAADFIARALRAGHSFTNVLQIVGNELPEPLIAVLIQRETGGNLAEILTSISHIIRERLKLVAKVRVLSAEGRMSAWILGLLPFGVASVLLVTNGDYIRILWTDPTGVKLLWAALVMVVIGVSWLRRMIRIHI